MAYFVPAAATVPPDQDAEYDLLQKRAMFYLEQLLAAIAERRDETTFNALVEVVEDLAGHCLWAMAEDGRRFELLKDRRSLPGDD